eukprot:TRINITY_DN13126_c0_g4_i1.p1 TRINITY_DN13126_c0_g4~~TRINITY_DN13126_c0_g4_i1.p1  ORF type:complete len:308 (-),score=77.24 TRINITY_DN13126_c0_g4_i1:170-1093(-)
MPFLTVNDNIIWRQRIEKEEKVNCKPTSGGFCVRNVVSVMDVPTKFKPGHIDPSKPAEGGFKPEDYGWKPDDKIVKEFRSALLAKESCPRERYLYPQTSAQDHGWLLRPPGDLAERIRPSPKDRLGLGWRNKPSTVAPAAPPPAAAAAGKRAEPASKSNVSANKPLSQLSFGLPVPPAATGAHSQLSAAAPSRLSAAAPPRSRLSVAAASNLSASAPKLGQSANGTQLSRATSLPSALLPPMALAERREKVLVEAFDDTAIYLNKGEKGRLWGHPLGQTDVTKFANDFLIATGGVPLHKYGKTAPGG